MCPSLACLGWYLIGRPSPGASSSASTWRSASRSTHSRVSQAHASRERKGGTSSPPLSHCYGAGNSSGRVPSSTLAHVLTESAAASLAARYTKPTAARAAQYEGVGRRRRMRACPLNGTHTPRSLMYRETESMSSARNGHRLAHIVSLRLGQQTSPFTGWYVLGTALGGWECVEARRGPCPS
ncbi:hypothetical protein V8C26DRAFT_297731 [Trichoderma gracile]